MPTCPLLVRASVFLLCSGVPRHASLIALGDTPGLMLLEQGLTKHLVAERRRLDGLLKACDTRASIHFKKQRGGGVRFSQKPPSEPCPTV